MRGLNPQEHILEILSSKTWVHGHAYVDRTKSMKGLEILYLIVCGSVYFIVYFFHECQQKSAWPVSCLNNIAKFWHFEKIIGPYKVVLSYSQKQGQLAF